MSLPRTTRHADLDRGDLVAAAAGRTISVVIPALDEERTVGAVVATIRRALSERLPLVDEIVVVDGGSTDGTAARAAAAGATVVDQRAPVVGHPVDGAATGKGDALWRGLAATSGELVCFVDADVRDPGPELVAGPLAPLLLDPSISLVKAAYDRPLRAASGSLPRGGGRVTELLARPLIATFWPELGFLAQPLAGEYAGRREALERVPFVAGYGVELALLVDVAELLGPAAIAQVDLGAREHAHQPLDALGVMATEILAVALRRAAAQGRLPVGVGRDRWRLEQPIRDGDGVLGSRSTDVGPRERPPLRAGRP